MKIGKVEITAAEIEVYLEYFRVYQKYFYALVVCIVSLQLLFLWVAPELTEYRERTVVLTKFKRILKENEKKLLDKENIERELDRLKALVEEKENIFFIYRFLNLDYTCFNFLNVFCFLRFFFDSFG